MPPSHGKSCCGPPRRCTSILIFMTKGSVPFLLKSPHHSAWSIYLIKPLYIYIYIYLLPIFIRLLFIDYFSHVFLVSHATSSDFLFFIFHFLTFCFACWFYTRPASITLQLIYIYIHMYTFILRLSKWGAKVEKAKTKTKQNKTKISFKFWKKKFVKKIESTGFWLLFTKSFVDLQVHPLSSKYWNFVWLIDYSYNYKSYKIMHSN